jgi:membrane associated rhomboid family serine protease
LQNPAPRRRVFSCPRSDRDVRGLLAMLVELTLLTMSSHGKRGGRRLSLGQARITRGALYLLLAEAGLSLLFLLAKDPVKVEMARWITASSVQVWHELKIWTLATSALMQDQFIGLLFHGLILWLFVPILENWWGTRKLLLFALWTSLAGTTAGTFMGLLIGDPTPVMGLDPFIFGSIVAFGVLYGSHPVRFFGVLPMTGRQLMIGIIVVLALFVVLGGRWIQGAAYGAAMFLAWLMTSGTSNPRLWYLRWKHKRLRRRHLKVVRDDDDDEKWVN